MSAIYDIYDIYDEEQHGFRAGKSVTTASIDLIETIVSRLLFAEVIVSQVFL